MKEKDIKVTSITKTNEEWLGGMYGPDGVNYWYEFEFPEDIVIEGKNQGRKMRKMMGRDNMKRVAIHEIYKYYIMIKTGKIIE